MPERSTPAAAQSTSPPDAPATGKREALLRAALELFAEKTYGATPVPEIAARAHVGTGTVYRHFHSKEALANVVFRRCKTAMHETMLAALQDPDDDAGAGRPIACPQAVSGKEVRTDPARSARPRSSEQRRFLRLWHGLARLAASDPTALRFLELQHHEEYLDADSRGLSDAVFATAETFVRDGQRAGAIREASPAIVISLVFGAFVGLFKESCSGRFALGDVDIAAAGESVWRMIRS